MCFKTRQASTRDYKVIQILVHSHFDLVRMVAQMATQMISSLAISCNSKDIGTKAAFLF